MADGSILSEIGMLGVVKGLRNIASNVRARFLILVDEWWRE
jgi:hypothetical protein